MVVLFQQDAEKRDFFSNFSADGLHDGGTLLVISLESQEIKRQPFPMTQPSEKALPIGSLWHSLRKSSERERKGGRLRGQYAPARRDETVIRSIQECQRRVRLCP